MCDLLGGVWAAADAYAHVGFIIHTIIAIVGFMRWPSGGPVRGKLPTCWPSTCRAVGFRLDSSAKGDYVRLITRLSYACVCVRAVVYSRFAWVWWTGQHICWSVSNSGFDGQSEGGRGYEKKIIILGAIFLILFTQCP